MVSEACFLEHDRVDCWMVDGLRQQRKSYGCGRFAVRQFAGEGSQREHHVATFLRMVIINDNAAIVHACAAKRCWCPRTFVLQCPRVSQRSEYLSVGLKWTALQHVTGAAGAHASVGDYVPSCASPTMHLGAGAGYAIKIREQVEHKGTAGVLARPVHGTRPAGRPKVWAAAWRRAVRRAMLGLPSAASPTVRAVHRATTMRPARASARASRPCPFAGRRPRGRPRTNTFSGGPRVLARLRLSRTCSGTWIGTHPRVARRGPAAAARCTHGGKCGARIARASTRGRSAC